MCKKMYNIKTENYQQIIDEKRVLFFSEVLDSTASILTFNVLDTRLFINDKYYAVIGKGFLQLKVIYSAAIKVTKPFFYFSKRIIRNTRKIAQFNEAHLEVGSCCSNLFFKNHLFSKTKYLKLTIFGINKVDNDHKILEMVERCRYRHPSPSFLGCYKVF